MRSLGRNVLSCLAVSWWLCLSLGHQCGNSQSSLDSVTLNHTSFRTMPLQHHSWCFEQCAADLDCQSYSFDFTISLCRLYNTSHLADASLLVQDTNSVYMLGVHHPCNAMSQYLCKNMGRCARGGQCLCVRGFSGKICRVCSRKKVVSLNFPSESWAEVSGSLKIQKGGTHTFLLTEGLNKVSDAVSFESWERPGYYIKHSGSYANLHLFTDTTQFKTEASFIRKQSPLDSQHLIFESCASSNHYIRHINSALRVNQFVNKDLFKKDMSFKLVDSCVDP